MRNVAFLFPGSGPYEALDGWVRALSRHAREFDVHLCRSPEECRFLDATFVLTEVRTYPREQMDADLLALRSYAVPFAVVHNHDNPPVPAPGPYPSFCWTRAGCRRWTACVRDCDPVFGGPFLLRQPVFPAVVRSPPPEGLPLIATFGSVEYKKHTLEMARWAKKNDLPFLVLGPEVLAREYKDYAKVVRSQGAAVRLYPWQERVEDLASYMGEVSHFLFVLPASKAGSGGSPTSPRYATFFNRPVIVVDDEDTFREDGFHVFQRLDDIPVAELGTMGLPRYDWGPDAYLGALVEKTLAFWGKT